MLFFSCCPIFFVLFLDYYLEAHLNCDLLDQTPSLSLLQWISAEDTTWAPSGLHPYCEDSRGWNQSSRRLFKRVESIGSKRLFISCLGRQQSQRNMHLIQALPLQPVKAKSLRSGGEVGLSSPLKKGTKNSAHTL